MVGWLAREAYYGAAVPMAECVARVVGRHDAKVLAALRGRRVPRADARRAEAMDVWFHASSLGEFEQARPIIQALRARHPSLAAWVSFFSPSGLDHARGYPGVADVFYLPFRRRDLRIAFDVIRPSALVVIRFDVWPGLLWEASRRGVPAVLVDATLRPDSPRNHPMLRPAQRSFYRNLSRVLAVTESDADHLRRLCGRGVPVETSGDSRFDRVWERATSAKSLGSLDDMLGTGPRPILVAGSTYDPEERVLAEALSILGESLVQVRVVIVPHEPTEDHLRAAERRFKEAGWHPQRLSALSPGEPWQMLLLDRVGVLAECYRHADWVMVGGSFKAKVHNVLEPAAWGKPIVVGPLHGNSPEAVDMVARGAMSAVVDAAGLASTLRGWIEDPAAAAHQGAMARDFLVDRLGASERIAEAIGSLLPPTDSLAARGDDRSYTTTGGTTPTIA